MAISLDTVKPQFNITKSRIQFNAISHLSQTAINR